MRPVNSNGRLISPVSYLTHRRRHEIDSLRDANPSPLYLLASGGGCLAPRVFAIPKRIMEGRGRGDLAPEARHVYRKRKGKNGLSSGGAACLSIGSGEHAAPTGLVHLLWDHSTNMARLRRSTPSKIDARHTLSLRESGRVRAPLEPATRANSGPSAVYEMSCLLGGTREACTERSRSVASVGSPNHLSRRHGGRPSISAVFELGKN